MDLDYALRVDKPTPLSNTSTQDEKFAYEKWERSNRLSLMIMKGSISSDIRGGLPDSENAKDFLDSVEEQFQSSSKALVTTLIIKMVTSKYNGFGGVRGHILRMTNMATQLKGKKWKRHGKDKRHVKKNNDGNKAKTSAKKGKMSSYVCYESFVANVPIDTWWIDSGASVHITCSSQGFRFARKLNKGERNILVRNGNKVPVEAVGTLPLVLESGFKLDLFDTFYVPSITRNLILVSRLVAHGRPL
ncbi:hypothetical protein ZIOFF_042367 [Zingiber officinale]|uniref:Retrovirus-related Pol polyprotein from transposon TNT 1-94-like beta-barrel domain-containing protein n=1 Tax=Zingiber officinale TaxID=94328 RepID=A0A8J5KVE5_ZINOF|nr:hypothetical protein ZIOFF_042367 [Zingiber officinale]